MFLQKMLLVFRNRGVPVASEILYFWTCKNVYGIKRTKRCALIKRYYLEVSAKKSLWKKVHHPMCKFVDRKSSLSYHKKKHVDWYAS